MGLWGGGNSYALEGAEALNIFWSTPGLNLGALATIVVSVLALLFQTAACWLLGSILFRQKKLVRAAWKTTARQPPFKAISPPCGNSAFESRCGT